MKVFPPPAFGKMQSSRLFLAITIAFGILLFISQLIDTNHFYKVGKSYIPLAYNDISQFNGENEPNQNGDVSLDLYVRLTTIKAQMEHLENWPIPSMKLFFVKKLLNLVVVLDDEKKEDHEYGDKLLKEHYDINIKICYAKSLSNDIYHNWGYARMYLDMMHAELCSTKEYIGFIDSDTIFVTAVTEETLFENKKPVVVGKIGIPINPCWIQTGEYVLGFKQVIQAMAYFPVTFKIAHIREMRKYVEEKHKKPFTQVFKEAPEVLNLPVTYCYCHFSIMANYVWRYHRSEYAWHLQPIPNGLWNGERALAAMVGPDYFKNEIKENEKVPIARAAVHGRHMYLGEKYYGGQPIPLAASKNLMREGLCHSVGFELCPKSCDDFNANSLQGSLFSFEMHNWKWDARCGIAQSKHYKMVHKMLQNNPEQFNVNLSNKTRLCTILDNLRMNLPIF